nr:glycosyltransferase [uncultured Sphingomonas sp.]
MSGPLIIYVHDLKTSGVVRNALAIARRVGKDREVILCAGPTTNPDHGIDASPARLEILRPSWLGLIGKKYSAIPGLRALVCRTGATALMSAGNLGDRAVYWASKRLPIRTAYRISNAIGRPRAGLTNWLRDRRHRRIAETASRLIMVGNAITDHPVYAAAARDGRAVAIANGVDVERARTLAQEPPPHPWLEGPVPVVLGIGRLHKQKNFPRLIAASAKAMANAPHRLVIIGSGPQDEAQALQSQAEAAGIADQFLLAGHQSNVFAWLSRAQLFALVSRWEGSSNALLEAMAVGTPVLASRQAGDAEAVLGNGQFGRLVDGEDYSDIARGIAEQLTDAITPGNRIDSYRLDDTLDRYAQILTAL